MSASFYDLLKYAKTGIAAPDMTAYDKMRAVAMGGGGAIKTLTGVPPLIFNSNGKPLISWSMLGNGSQTGTPTPDAPIMPTFCGVRTENLFDGFDYYGVVPSINNGNNANYNNGASTDYIKIDNPLITLSKDSSFVNARIYIFLYNENKTFIGYAMSDDIKIVSWNISNYVSAKFARIRVDGYGQYVEQYMLNLGSTALPYEPCGWAIPITNAGQTTPVYLGQVPTVRRIKKLVLDGTENYGTSGSNTWLILGTRTKDFRGTADGAICSHLPLVLRSNFTTNTCAWGGGQIGDFLINIDNKSMTDLKSYIASQYSAGTPVTIWYVLAEPETGIVNEPLAKIGSYADVLNSEDSGVSIPTARGQNTLTVDTDLKPSEMTITYRG